MDRCYRLLTCLALGAALSLGAACSEGKAVVEGLEKIRDKACACEDAECGGEVLDEYVGFLTDNKDKQGTEEQVKEAGQINQETLQCLHEAGVSQEALMEAGEALEAPE